LIEALNRHQGIYSPSLAAVRRSPAASARKLMLQEVGILPVRSSHVSTGAHHDRPGGLPWPTRVRGLRYPVQTLLQLLASGMTFEEVLADYPDLERDDLLAALEFGALTAGGQRIDPPGAA
jgi:uncharacterized protein (DUF433 family)